MINAPTQRTGTRDAIVAAENKVFVGKTVNTPSRNSCQKACQTDFRSEKIKEFLIISTYEIKLKYEQCYHNKFIALFIILSFIKSFWIELKLCTPKNFTLSKVIRIMHVVNVE